MSGVFEKRYNELNSEQKEAVDTLEGPVMVVAGPGTGKTQILTLRIANILLQEKAKPEEILALTFTDSGVAAMRRRLLNILGPKAYYIPIHTFHAFCNEVIQDNPDEFPSFHDKNIVDDIGRMQIMEGVIQERNLKLLKPFGDNFMYVSPLLKTFSDMKREGIGPEKLHEFVLEEEKQFKNIEDLYHEKGAHKGKMKGPYKVWEHNIAKNKEMVGVYAIYQTKLHEVGYDYDDIILSAVERLEGDAALLQRLQERYKYLLADEHQDTNQAQNKILELLSSHNKSPNIFVVGDEKQSIYRFQGANLANFLYFHSTFPNAKIITLRENYRSTQSILDASGSIMKDASQALVSLSQAGDFVGLTASSSHKNKKTRIYSFQNLDSENYFFAKKIKKLLNRGVEAQEIAVLYRDNHDAFPIRDMLEKNNIPCNVESNEQLLENKDIKNLFLLIKAVSNFGSDEHLAKALHADFLKIPALDIYKVFQSRKVPDELGLQSKRLHDILRSKEVMRALGVSRATRLNDFYKKLSSWTVFSHNKSAPQVFEAIVRESGFFDHIISKKDYIEGVARVRSLHAQAKRLSAENKNYTLNDFVRHLELIQDRGISLREKNLATKRSAIRLMTAHRSKGLEFDYVFIAGATMGHWGKRQTRQMLKPPSSAKTLIEAGTESDKEDDERRLFYVALTRARKQVYISYPRTREDGRELFPSQFIEEIADAHKASGDGEVYEKSLSQNPKIFFAKRKDTRIKEDEKEFLREIFATRGLSPTALNNYLTCPWRYFYSNLLQIPRAKTKHEMYGTAIHEALRDLFDNHINYTGQTRVVRNYLLERFERALSREPISDHDFQESLEKGKETLSKYYASYKDAWHTNTVNEFAIKNVFLDGEVRLTGKIDKIEILQNVAGSDPATKSQRVLEVNVVDYKTGKRKTRNDLEGGTKTSTGNEKRQLVFYKLLLDKLPDSPYVMISGEIDFVEPEKRTEKLYKEKFEITADDVRDLEYKIQDVTAEILGFSFWDSRCDDKNCEYCKLRDIGSELTQLPMLP